MVTRVEGRFAEGEATGGVLMSDLLDAYDGVRVEVDALVRGRFIYLLKNLDVKPPEVYPSPLLCLEPIPVRRVRTRPRHIRAGEGPSTTGLRRWGHPAAPPSRQLSSHA